MPARPPELFAHFHLHAIWHLLFATRHYLFAMRHLSIRDAARHVATKTVQARIPESSRSEPYFYRLAGLDIPITVGAVPSAASARPSSHGLQAYFHLHAVRRASQKRPSRLSGLPAVLRFTACAKRHEPCDPCLKPSDLVQA